MDADAHNPFAYTAPPAVATTPPVPPPPDEYRGKVAVWPVFVVYLAALLACLVVQVPVVIIWLVVRVAAGGKPDDVTEVLNSPAGFISLAAPAQLCFVAAWWLATRLADRRLIGLRTLGSTRLGLWAYACLAIGSIAPLTLGEYLAEGLKWLIGDWDTDLVSDLYKNLDLATGVVLVAFIGLVPALVEELFFRGYMQRRLLARWSPWIAVPVVGFLFAISHGAPGWAMTILPWGIWVGIMAWRTGSLWPGIVTHAFINGGINAWRVGAKLGAWPEEPSEAFVAGFWGLVIACLAVSVWVLIRYQPPAQAPEVPGNEHA